MPRGWNVVRVAKGGVVDITRKTDYALRMLAELTRHPGETVSVRKAAEQNGIPYAFARTIQYELTCAGILESVRGSRGGVRLSIDPATTTLIEIIDATQGTSADPAWETVPGDGEQDSSEAAQQFFPLWGNADRIMRRFFASITLKQAAIDGLMPDYQGGFELVPVRK